MELLKKYYEERTPGKSLVYNDKGFCTYEIRGEECYIVDVYVEPEYRRSGVATAFEDEISAIARKNGCTYMTGSVVPSLALSTSSILAFLTYGYKLHGSIDNFIILKKDL